MTKEDIINLYNKMIEYDRETVFKATIKYFCDDIIKGHINDIDEMEILALDSAYQEYEESFYLINESLNATYFYVKSSIYLMTLNNGTKYYSNEDDENFLIIENDGKSQIQTESMSPLSDILFAEFEGNEDIQFSDISMTAHYNIRCMIDNDLDKNDSADIIKKYEIFCKDNNITKKQIDESVELDSPDIFKELDDLVK